MSLLRMRIVRKLRVGVGLMGMLACTREPVESSPSEDAVLTEHRTALAAQATQGLGENCTTHGASECLSGVCLHTGTERDDGYFCSVNCTAAKECPEQWQCAQVYPGVAQRVCVPPSDWKAALAKPRG